MVVLSYIETIKIGFIVFPLLAGIFTIPFMLYNYHKYGSINKLRTLIIYSFILYLLIMYFLVILPLPSIDSVKNMTTPYMRIKPFNFVKDIIDKNYTELMPTIFNIIMTIPFGIYLRYYFKFDFKKTTVTTLLLSLFFELTQLTGLYFIYPRPYRLFDVDDLITNTLGGMIGYGIGKLFMKILPSRESIDYESFTTGKKVSGLRRICVFGLDIFNYLAFTGITYYFFRDKRVGLIIFILYYLLVPLISRGYTIGSYYLHVKVEFKRWKYIKYMLRNLLIFIYYILIYYIVIKLGLYIIRIKEINPQYRCLFILGIISVGIFLDIISILHVIEGHDNPYDTLLKTEYVSDIEIPSNIESDKKEG